MRRPSRSYRWKRTSLGCVAGYSRTGSVTSPNDRVPVHTAVAMGQGYRGGIVRRKCLPGGEPRAPIRAGLRLRGIGVGEDLGGLGLAVLADTLVELGVRSPEDLRGQDRRVHGA